MLSPVAPRGARRRQHPWYPGAVAVVPRTLADTWAIGTVEIPSRVVLAPMAGVSVQAFRRQGRRFGAGLVCSEMVSACGLNHANERTLGYLRKFYPWYVERLGEGKALQGALQSTSSIEDARQVLALQPA